MWRCTWFSVYVYIYAHAHIYIYTYTYVCEHTYLNTYLHAYVYILHSRTACQPERFGGLQTQNKSYTQHTHTVPAPVCIGVYRRISVCVYTCMCSLHQLHIPSRCQQSGISRRARIQSQPSKPVLHEEQSCHMYAFIQRHTHARLYTYPDSCIVHVCINTHVHHTLKYAYVCVCVCSTHVLQELTV